MHILMGDPLTPLEAERKGLVHENRQRQGSRSGAMGDCTTPVVISAGIGCLHQASRPQTPPRRRLAQGLALERNLFLKLCISETGTRARMRAYEEEHITSPSSAIVVQARSASHD